MGMTTVLKVKGGALTIASVLVMAMLSACGGGGGGTSTSNTSNFVPSVLGGVVQGLAVGDRLVISNGQESLAISANGTFQFKMPIQGSATVAVTTQPQSGVLCAVSDANTASNSNATFSPSANSFDAVQIDCSIYPAFKVALPQVTTPKVGAVPVIDKNARIIPVYYTDTPNQTAHTTFLQKLVTSSIWNILNQYGIGVATVGSPVLIPNPAPPKLAAADIKAMLANNAATWTTKLDASVFFMIYIPSTTTSDISACGGGYHSVANVNGVLIPFALMTGCDPERVAQHEIMEGVADPEGYSGYSTLATDKAIWTDVIQNYESVEIADMCETARVSVDDLPGYSLQPIWSNAAAAAGLNPCQSGNSSNGVFFGAVPVLSTMLTNKYGAQDHGVIVTPGSSMTIPVKIFSNSPLAGAMTVSVALSGAVNNASPSWDVTFKFDKTAAKNGDTLMLTITAPKAAFSGMYTFSITARNGQDQFSFPGGVSNTQTY